MTDPSPTITKDEIAALLQLAPSTFQRNRATFMANGMPRPIPGTKLLWSRRNVLAWIDGDLVAAGVLRHEPTGAPR